MATPMVSSERRAHVVLFPFMAQGHVAPFLCLAQLVCHRSIILSDPNLTTKLRTTGMDTPMVSSERRAHVVLFPFMAQGHVAPFLCLAQLVRRARPDAGVTMVATPRVAESLRAGLGLAVDSDFDNVVRGGVRVHALPFDPARHGLPAGSDTTASISFHQIIALFVASESLRPAFHGLVADLKAADPGADFHIMADMFLGWTVDVARDAGVSHSTVVTGGAYGSAVYFSLWNSVPLPATVSTGDAFPLPLFPNISVHRSQITDHLAAADGKDAWSTFMKKQITAFSRTDALLVNAEENLEPEGLRMLWQWLNVPIYPVGPLLRAPAPATTMEGKQEHSSWTILAWLDKQLPGSALYISFGSQNTINASQMMELAMGLEQSGDKFVWVIRPPVGFDVNGEFRPEWLPEGFRERVEAGGQGLVVRCWAPQVEILPHAATGAFLTHCGWNSVLGSLGNGVPLLGWPLSAEQFYNAKMLAEDMGVCVEVARGMGAVLSREKLAAAVETVLGDTAERATMRRKAGKMKEVINAASQNGGDGSVKVVERFFADMHGTTARD